MSNADDREAPRPSKPPSAPQAPRPSKQPPPPQQQQQQRPRPSRAPDAPPSQGPRPSKPPQEPRPSRRPPYEQPRPSKRPPNEPFRPSKGPPQQGRRSDDQRPSKRPPNPQGTPSIPRPPRVPGEGPPNAQDPRGRGRPGQAPQGQRPPQQPQRPQQQRPQQPPQPQRPQGPRPGDARAPERRPNPQPQAPQPRASQQPQPQAQPEAVSEAPRRVYLPLTAQSAELDPLGEPEFPEYDWPEGATLAGVAMVRTPDASRATAVDAGNAVLRKGDTVVLEGERGVDLAVVTAPPRRQMVSSRLPLRVLRRAGEADLRAETRMRVREADATKVAAKVVHELKLPAKVVRVECGLTGARTVVHLASEERLELRDVARALTTALRGRVEIRHVGVRDAAKNLGGVGPCGLQLCCNTFLSEFAPVSIRHAKDQGLALTPQRVSGVCGRLMCCLVYEDAFYRQQRALFPKQNKRVITPKGEGRVRDVDVLARTVRVLFPDGQIDVFKVEEVRSATAPDPSREGSAAPEPADDDGPDEGADDAADKPDAPPEA